jgi:hypothetical protein
MQIASLIANDRFMSRNNLSAPSEDFVDRMADFPTFWLQRPPGFKSEYESPHVIMIYLSWSNQYYTNWTRVQSKTGFCSTFNYPNVSQMFFQDR